MNLRSTIFIIITPLITVFYLILAKEETEKKLALSTYRHHSIKQGDVAFKEGDAIDKYILSILRAVVCLDTIYSAIDI